MPSIVNMINERGIFVNSDLVNLNGQVYINDDNVPAPENMSSSADDKEDSNDCVFSND